jgi:ribosomal peptide maturation radical SAM protein 1
MSVGAWLPDSDVLLIVPPFAPVNRACLGVHLLQACAKQTGFEVAVFYANLAAAAAFGPRRYLAVHDAPPNLFAGERVFAASAYGVPPLGRDADSFLSRHALPEEEEIARCRRDEVARIRLKESALKALEAKAGCWADDVAAAIAARNFKIVGCTTMFEQTAASIALLSRIKRLRPDIVTIIGGANCEGEMAEGVAALSDEVDFVFSGESEQIFVDFLRQQRFAEARSDRIIQGQPCSNLDTLPTPDFHEYYDQVGHFLPAVAAKQGVIPLIYETSRGCWWGQKHHCTFCGLNGLGMGFREKSSGKIIGELKQLLTRHPSSRVQMTDNIMPHSFFRTLLPDLTSMAKDLPSVSIFYEQKANLSLKQVLALMAARITHIQAGIEGLSTSLLKRMDKGVTVAQNVALLRYARSVGMTVDWNLLWGFPGDELREYEEALALLPLLRHLEPPSGFFRLSIDRFSPYFDVPDRYQVTNISPWPGFEMILPPEVDSTKVAYHFMGEFESASTENPSLIREIQEQVSLWIAAWNPAAGGHRNALGQPTLEVRRVGAEYILHDTRSLAATQEYTSISTAQASAALTRGRSAEAPELDWALDRKVGVVVDGDVYVPLATAAPDLLQEFESEKEHASRVHVGR